MLIDRIYLAGRKLEALGWKLISIPRPSAGEPVLTFEMGSCGVHETHIDENLRWWVAEADDLWPSHPAMWRYKPNA